LYSQVRNHPAPALAPLEVTVNLKKIVAWLVVAFVIFYVIQAPEQSAQMVKNAGNALGDAATSLANFVKSLT
jgi:large-conductance mechanosensitive channel